MTIALPRSRARFARLTATVLGLLGLICGVASGTAATDARADDRPNFVFIIVDDERRLRQNHLEEGRRPDGGPRNVSPTLDRFAAEGTVLPRMYATTPICVPSRFACLTGRLGSRAVNATAMRSVETHGYPMVAQNTFILSDTPTLPRTLQQAGYFTGAIGKNHVIDVPDFEGFAASDDPNDPAIIDQLRRNHERVRQAFLAAGFDHADRLYHDNLAANQPRALRAHNLDWLAEGALAFLDLTNDRPFFLYLATTTPHGPNGSPHTWDADRRITPRGLLDKPMDLLVSADEIRRRLTAAGIDPMQEHGREGNTVWSDDLIRVVVERLEEMGELDNTVVVFFNDHGIEQGKSSLYEGGMRTSAVFWGPGAGVEAQRLNHTLAANVDFMPTFLSMAGIDPETSDTTLDGVDLSPVLRGETHAVRDHVIGELGYSRAVVGERFKYLALRPSEYAQNVPPKVRRQQLRRWFARRDRIGLPRGDNQPDDPYPHTFNIPGGTDNNWPSMRKHPHYFDPDQLYDLQADPDEQRNLADDPAHAETLERLRARLDAYVRSTPYPFGEFGASSHGDR
ncbi:MAG: sulfatase-like hydrolase/transferase [Planctomycetota bacterium]